ncbi:MAG: ATP-binding protein, partial [Anaerolineae bacterium]
GAQGGANDWYALARRWGAQLGAHVTIIGNDGAVLGDSLNDHGGMGNHLTRPEVLEALNQGAGASLRFSPTEGRDLLYVARRVTAGGQTAGVVRLAVSLQQIEGDVTRQGLAIAAATGIALVMAVLLSLFIAERTARPIRWLTQAAGRLAKGDLSVRLSPSTRDEVGELTRTFNAMADRLQEQVNTLDTERSRLAGVLEHMADGVIITDGSGQVRLINAAAAGLLQTRSAEATGLSVATVLRHHQLIDLWQRALAQRQEETAAVEVEHQGLFLQAIVSPLAGVERGYLIILQDLTRIRRLETVRRDFVSNISHELRTPLASLKALVDTLRDGALEDPPAAQRFLDRIEGEVDAMSQMVQELLELARIESGQVPLLLRAVPLREIIGPPTERLRPQAERANVALQVEAVPDISALADAERVQQVVTNLVHNAVKFTPAGGRVAVTAWVQADEAVIEVRDTGVGIPAADLPRIFERFYKVRGARGSGTGLGLAIARHIVQAHEGRIWAESQEGRGSVFRFTLPLA